ncbi:MAG: glycosyltransferase family 2 protein [Elusimicrobia bacterium]|nr:glycosyltransferase family 2 protein [Elusimicrobiota bacterium]
MTQPPELTVLTLTLNEGKALGRFLRRLTMLESRVGSYELLVIDGGSTDRSVEIAREGGARVVMQAKPGYASAYLQGLSEARGRYILCVDADSSHPLEIVSEFWRRREEFSAVCGSRYLPGGGDARPWLRRLMSRLLNSSYAAFLSVPLTDISGGFRLYRAEAVRDMRCRARHYDVVAEILVRLHSGGHRILEIPYRYVPRQEGASKARLLYFSYCYIKTMLELWWWLRFGRKA